MPDQTRLRPLLVIGVVLAQAVLVSCSASVEEASDAIGDVAAQQQRPVAYEDLLETGLREGSDYQKAFLEDGEITTAEYEAAVYASVACMEEKGLSVDGPNWVQNGTVLMYAASLGGGSEPDASLTMAMEECHAEYESFVQQLYLTAIAPMQAEIATRLEGYRECLEEAGVRIYDDMTEEEVDDLATDKHQYDCIDEWSVNQIVIRTDR